MIVLSCQCYVIKYIDSLLLKLSLQIKKSIEIDQAMLFLSEI